MLAFFLQMLRYLLVQDYDANDDGRADTLRLAFATPRRWLEDGKEIVVERAPTQFGDVSFHIKSDLKHGEVTAEIDLPPRAPKHTFLRLRLPENITIISADGPQAGPKPSTSPANKATARRRHSEGKLKCQTKIRYSLTLDIMACGQLVRKENRRRYAIS